MPKLSIIIPCFNKGEYLDGSLSSALSQTFRETEAIVVNDGSTDPFTLKKLSEISDPRVRVIHTPQSGPPVARNNGIREAGGEYIITLDCGDSISPEYAGLAIGELDKDKGVGIVYSGAEMTGAKAGPMETPEYSRDVMLVRNLIHPGAFFRKADWERAGGYNANMVYGWEDWDFWLSIIAIGAGVRKISGTHFYRREDSSRTLDSYRQSVMRLQVMLNHRDLYGRAAFESMADMVPFAELFADTGKGFGEGLSAVKVLGDFDGIKEMEFDLKPFKGAKALRFDPLNGHAIVKLKRIELWTVDGKVIRVQDCATNGFDDKGALIFPTDDPQVHLNIDPRLKDVVKAVFRVEYLATGKEAARLCMDSLVDRAGIPLGAKSAASRIMNFIRKK